MNTQFINMGDVSPAYGQIWIRYGGEDYAEAVEIQNASETGDASDNVWIIRKGSIYFSPRNWDAALSCCDSGIYGPPEYLDVAYAFNAYQGMDLDTYGGFEIVQIGKRDSFGDETEYHRPDGADVVLHGNAKISRYLARNYLES